MACIYTKQFSNVHLFNGEVKPFNEVVNTFNNGEPYKSQRAKCDWHLSHQSDDTWVWFDTEGTQPFDMSFESEKDAIKFFKKFVPNTPFKRFENED